MILYSPNKPDNRVEVESLEEAKQQILQGATLLSKEIYVLEDDGTYEFLILSNNRRVLTPEENIHFYHKSSDGFTRVLPVFSLFFLGFVLFHDGMGWTTKLLVTLGIGIATVVLLAASRKSNTNLKREYAERMTQVINRLAERLDARGLVRKETQ